jgi:hypothetical protein
VLEFAQPVVNFEPALIAGFGITLILTSRVINRIVAFLDLRESKHLPKARIESVEVRLGDAHSGSMEISASTCAQTTPVVVTSSTAAFLETSRL